jgi:hypothetical protein
MQNSSNGRRVLSAWFLAGVIACGIPIWLLPYNVTSGRALLTSIAAVALLAFLLRTVGRQSFGLALLVSGMALPAAVFARVVVEVTHDPTSHNLWPFELVIAGFEGLAGALPGALLGWLATRSRKERARA